jgi:hypothetical protein
MQGQQRQMQHSPKVHLVLHSQFCGEEEQQIAQAGKLMICNQQQEQQEELPTSSGSKDSRSWRIKVEELAALLLELQLLLATTLLHQSP